MTLIATMKQRLASPSDLVDLRHIPTMKGIRSTDAESRIGAATTHCDVASSAGDLRRLSGDLRSCRHDRRSACPPYGHDRRLGRQQRSGGGLSGGHAGARVRPSSPTSAQIAADDFFTGLFETALEDGEMITAITFEAPEKAGYAKFPNPASRYAMTGVFVAQGTMAMSGWRSPGRVPMASSAMPAWRQALAANWSPDALAVHVVDPSDTAVGSPCQRRISRQSGQGHGQARCGRGVTMLS